MSLGFKSLACRAALIAAAGLGAAVSLHFAGRRREPESSQRLRQRLPQPLQRLQTGKRPDPQMHARRRLQAVEGLHLRPRRRRRGFQGRGRPPLRQQPPLIFCVSIWKAAGREARGLSLWQPALPRKLTSRKATQRCLTCRHVGSASAHASRLRGWRVGMTRLLYDIEDYLEDAAHADSGSPAGCAGSCARSAVPWARRATFCLAPRRVLIRRRTVPITSALCRCSRR